MSLLKSNGTVSIFKFDNSNHDAKCISEVHNTLSNVVDLYMHNDRVYAIHDDNRVTAVGEFLYDDAPLTACTDIIKIGGGDESSTAALTSNGTMKFSGKIPAYFEEARKWNSIIDYFIPAWWIIGLTSTGKVYVAYKKANDSGEDNEYPEWAYRIGQTMQSWHNVVSISDTNNLKLVVAITNEGNLLFAGDTDDAVIREICQSCYGIKTYESEKYKLICEQSKKLAKIEMDRVNQTRQMADYREKKVCQHCGGSFRGLFKKTCSKCGRRKDY